MRWLGIAIAVGCGCGSPRRGTDPPPLPHNAAVAVDAAVAAAEAAVAVDAAVAAAEAADAAELWWGLPAPSVGTSRVIGTPMPAIPPLCLGQALTEDLNHDGKADVRRIYELTPGGQSVQRCKQMDFDYDGRWDVTMVYDAAGNMVLELDDFDYDGTVDLATVANPATGTQAKLYDADRNGVVDAIGP